MAKHRIKEIKKLIGNSDGGNMNDMFEEMLGLKEADLEVIRPKMVRCKNIIRKIHGVLQQLGDFKVLREDFAETTQGLDEIKKFADSLRQELKIADVDETEDLYAQLDKSAMNEEYKQLKENPYLKRLIVLCGNLKNHSKNFNDLDNLKTNFVNQEAGLSFYIFDFSSLDLKQLWFLTENKLFVRKYILTILYHLYRNLFDLYKCITSPDVDIEKFTIVLMSSIEELKKQPKLNRCRNAFNKIEQSVDLLRNNFDQYYRDSIASQNMAMIMENFISDVSKQEGNSPVLIREFRVIVSYMHEVSQKSGKNKDPNIKKIFNMLGQHFDVMEKQFSGDKPDNDTENNSADNTNNTDANNQEQKKREHNESKNIMSIENMLQKQAKKKINKKKQEDDDLI